MKKNLLWIITLLCAIAQGSWGQTQVKNESELAQAVKTDGANILMTGDIELSQPITIQGDVVGGESRIQVNDRFVTLDELGAAIEQERSQMSEENRQQMVVSIRADRATEMGLINDVKQELRKAGALHINYSATGKQKK